MISKNEIYRQTCYWTTLCPPCKKKKKKKKSIPFCNDRCIPDFSIGIVRSATRHIRSISIFDKETRDGNNDYRSEMITATSRHNERHEFDLLAFVRLTPFLEHLSLLRDTFVLGDDYFTPAHGESIRVIDKGASLSAEDLLIIVCASFKNNRRLRVTSRCRIFWDVLFIHDLRRHVCATTFSWPYSIVVRDDGLWGISSRNHCNRLAAQERERSTLNENVNCPRNFDR